MVPPPKRGHQANTGSLEGEELLNPTTLVGQATMDSPAALSGSAQDTADYNYSQIFLGQHDSARVEPLSDLQYGHLLNLGVSICPLLT